MRIAASDRELRLLAGGGKTPVKSFQCRTQRKAAKAAL
jgi:hypothetical protein